SAGASRNPLAACAEPAIMTERGSPTLSRHMHATSRPRLRDRVALAYSRGADVTALTRRQRRWLVAILLVAFGLRLWWVIYAARRQPHRDRRGGPDRGLSQPDLPHRRGPHRDTLQLHHDGCPGRHGVAAMDRAARTLAAGALRRAARRVGARPSHLVPRPARVAGRLAARGSRVASRGGVPRGDRDHGCGGDRTLVHPQQHRDEVTCAGLHRTGR